MPGTGRDVPPTTRAPELSIVIPCLDAAGVLAGQLEALAAQEWPGEWEVVIADNGSTDATRAVAAGYADRLGNLRIVDASAHRGRHHACNVGAASARGRAIAFVDADDAVAPGFVAAMAGALRGHPFVAARLDHTDDPGWMAGVGSAVQSTGLQNGFGFLPYGAGATLGFQRDAFDAVGGFREHATYCEDVDISWRTQLAGYPLEFVSDAVVRYRSRPTTRSMFRQHRQYGKAQALLFRDFRAAGMPAPSWSDTLAEWKTLARAVPRLRSRDAVARWSRRLGRSWGRLQGSLTYRVWYP